MQNNDEWNAIFMIVGGLFFMGVILGFLIGNVEGEARATKKTLNFCVEKPADCKIKYDFYQLENAN